MKLLTLLFAVVVSPLIAQSIPPCPTGQGVFYLQAAEWKPLQMISASGFGAHGFAKSAFSYGIASTKTVMVYRDAKAPFTTSAAPKFCLGSAPGELRNLVVVRVASKKDHREIQTGKANMYSGVKLEYRPEDIQAVDVAAQSPIASVVTLKAALKPGQYIIFPQTMNSMPAGYGGFDFGVD